MTLQSVKTFLVDHASSAQVCIFASIIVSLWIAEQIASHGPVGGKWRHTAVNAMFIFTALPIQIFLAFLMIMISEWVTIHRWGLVYLLPGADSPWIKYGLMFVVLDFLDYVYHVTMHRFSGLWRFHLVHHSDRKMDVSTTVREHPGESFIRGWFLIAYVFLCGASPFVLILRQTMQSFVNITSHTSFRLPVKVDRVLSWVFVTPNFHHVHHHYRLPYTNCNYGDVFSVWDRLFGTYSDLPLEKTVFGLDTHMDDRLNSSYRGIITMPFRKRDTPSLHDEAPEPPQA